MKEPDCSGIVGKAPILNAAMNADKLLAFRQTAYDYLGHAHDAMFELGDADEFLHILKFLSGT